MEPEWVSSGGGFEDVSGSGWRRRGRRTPQAGTEKRRLETNRNLDEIYGMIPGIGNGVLLDERVVIKER